MKIFVIDFSDTDHISDRFDKRFQIFTEKKDGEIAYKQVGEIMPDKIFINYYDKPSHGRQTAQAIAKRKKTSNIPIYFVDGNKNDNEKIKHIGQPIKFDEIEILLSK